MGNPLRLEAFDDIEEVAPKIAVETTTAWQSGYALGLEEGRLAAVSEQAALRASLVQCLNDISFGYHEARVHLSMALQPLFRAISETLIPELAKVQFAPRLVERLTELADIECDQALSLAVSPSQIKAISQLLGSTPDLALSLVVDPSLAEDQIEIRAAQTEELLDLSSLVHEAQAIMFSLFTAGQERVKHG